MPQDKYYAVKDGRTPGIYQSWNDASAQVTGHSGNVHKSFGNANDAYHYMVDPKSGTGPGYHPASISIVTFLRRAIRRMANKFYAVKEGRKAGIYTSWDDAKRQVDGYSGAVYKSFKDLPQAKQFLKGPGYANSGSATSNEPRTATAPRRAGPLRTTGKQTSRLNPNASPYARPGKSTEIDPAIKVQEVYTDGSAINNGTKRAWAGYGVYFGEDDPRNRYGPVTGLQTNNRGEMLGIYEALRYIKTTKPRETQWVIFADSEYALKSVTVWGDSWERRGWKRATGEIKNLDLVRIIRALAHELEAAGHIVIFRKVKGHSNVPGNEGADRLARLGATSR